MTKRSTQGAGTSHAGFAAVASTSWIYSLVPVVKFALHATHFCSDFSKCRTCVFWEDFWHRVNLFSSLYMLSLLIKRWRWPSSPAELILQLLIFQFKQKSRHATQFSPCSSHWCTNHFFQISYFVFRNLWNSHLPCPLVWKRIFQATAAE